jgi:hypothetical protein
MLLKASLSALTVLQLMPAAAGQQERFRQRQSTGCNVNTVRNRVEDVNRACCTSGVDCSGAAPSHCSTECAEVFRPFAEDCRAVLELFDSSELGGLDGSALELFLGTCEAANSCPMGYLEDTTAMVGVCSGADVTLPACGAYWLSTAAHRCTVYTRAAVESSLLPRFQLAQAAAAAAHARGAQVTVSATGRACACRRRCPARCPGSTSS